MTDPYYYRAMFLTPRQSPVSAPAARPVDTRRAYARSQVQAGYTAVVAGAITGAAAAYYSALARKYELRSQATSMDYEASVEALNATSFEQDASAELHAGQRNAGLRLLESGQEKATEATRTAARGVRMSGSAAEAVASIDYAGLVDAQTIRYGSIRDAGRLRMAAANARARSGAAAVSARNLRATSRSIRPADEFAAGLLSGAGQSAGMLTYYGGR